MTFNIEHFKKQKNTYIMKLTLLISIFLLINNSIFCQDKAARIAEIKKMYAEATELSLKKKDCESGKKIEYEGFDEASEKMPFEQTAEKCKLANNYVSISASLQGYEWNINVTYYYKNEKLFFVFISNGAEACFVEYRVYFDENQKIIKLLEKSNDCDGGDLKKNNEITDAKEFDETMQLIEQNKIKIDEILINK